MERFAGREEPCAPPGPRMAEGGPVLHGQRLDRTRPSTLDYYLDLATVRGRRGPRARDRGHGGSAAPRAARRLVTALRERFDLPLHLHAHDAGGRLRPPAARRVRGGRGRGRCRGGVDRGTAARLAPRSWRRWRTPERDTNLGLDIVSDMEPSGRSCARITSPWSS
ncbi:hypothetical protein QJS66_05775 [Kocuria rhizophila]|nr:hypothetical protein QJS66_05775 [Kocuria rhizophila]